MSVHKAISAHSKKQNEIVMKFIQLENLREKFIEEAIYQCQHNEPFSTDKINEVTKKINELAKSGIAEQRKIVTEDMVREFVNRNK
ncbi:MAG: YpbS family protein [Bacillaceae bacterium]|nr:YpbS family protein [Bacillaceae bacterium]